MGPVLLHGTQRRDPEFHRESRSVRYRGRAEPAPSGPHRICGLPGLRWRGCREKLAALPEGEGDLQWFGRAAEWVFSRIAKPGQDEAFSGFANASEQAVTLAPNVTNRE